MEARAINYVLNWTFNEGECFCGQKISSLSEKCRTRLETLIKYLPPNNLGENIKVFEANANSNCRGGEEFQRNHQKAVETIIFEDKDIDDKKQRKKLIDDAIKDFPDIGKKKEREQELERKISDTERLIGSIMLSGIRKRIRSMQ